MLESWATVDAAAAHPELKLPRPNPFIGDNFTILGTVPLPHLSVCPQLTDNFTILEGPVGSAPDGQPIGGGGGSGSSKAESNDDNAKEAGAEKTAAAAAAAATAATATRTMHGRSLV